MKQKMATPQKPQSQKPQTQGETQPEANTQLLDKITDATRKHKKTVTAYSCSFQFTPFRGCGCHRMAARAGAKLYRVKNPVTPCHPSHGTGWYSLEPKGWQYTIEIPIEECTHDL